MFDFHSFCRRITVSLSISLSLSLSHSRSQCLCPFQLLAFLQGLFTFYHEGYELASEFEPYKQQLQFNLQNVSMRVRVCTFCLSSSHPVDQPIPVHPLTCVCVLACSDP